MSQLSGKQRLAWELTFHKGRGISKAEVDPNGSAPMHPATENCIPAMAKSLTRFIRERMPSNPTYSSVARNDVIHSGLWRDEGGHRYGVVHHAGRHRARQRSECHQN